MFPAGSPTNAIVYEAAKLKTREMAIPGFFAKFICLSVVILSTNTWGYVIYNMRDSQNNTTLSTNIPII
jgi:di/tricarboxylate transporter